LSNDDHNDDGEDGGDTDDKLGSNGNENELK